MRACLILPTFNEAENLERLVAAVRALGTAIELIVDDDRTQDGTGRIADALAERREDVAVLHRSGTRGYG